MVLAVVRAAARTVQLALAMVPLAAVPALSQSYPSQSVRIIVPFAPGSSTDSLARVVADELQKKLGGTFVVENKPGASGMIAAEEVSRAKPDGHTLFITTNTTHSANPSLFKALRYDPVKDFTPIQRLTSGQFILCVNVGVPAKSVEELIALGKKEPKALSYGTPNSTSLMSTEVLKAMAGIEILQVPYKSATAAYTDLMAGRISLMFGDQLNAVPLVQSGKVRGLAVSGTARSPLVPDLPTMEEAGLKGFAVNSWAGMFGPAGVPQEIVAGIHKVLDAALQRPDFRTQLEGFGYTAVTQPPDAFGKFVADEIVKWRRAIQLAKIEPQ